MMEQNHLESESKDLHESPPLKVAILGFAAIDEESFSRFFQVVRIDKPTYVAANSSDKNASDILMVNYDNPAARAESEAILVEHPHIQFVAVSRGPLDEPPEHHIRGMLFAARVLTTLDKIVVISPVIKAMPDQAPLTSVEENQDSLIGTASNQISLTEVQESVSQPAPLPETAVVQSQPSVQALEAPAPQVQNPWAVKPASVENVTTSDALPAQPQSPVAATQPQEVASAWPPQLEQKPAPQVQPIQPETIIPTSAPAPVVVAKEVEAGGYRTLVVDDSLAIQKSLELNLATLAQISVIDFADSGEIALEKAEAVQYDLIFLDVMMPGIDGYETCTRLRKKPEYKKTPIIMVSGKTSPLDEVKGVMAGCTTYLTKPVQQEAFQKLSIRVLAWLDKQKKP
jgi:two-component system, cell cycle response regulator